MKLIRFALIILGTLLLIDGAVLSIISNFNTGNILVLSVGAVLFIWGCKYEAINKRTENTIGRFVKTAITAGLICTIAMCTFFAVYGTNDTATYEEDVLLVLGCAVKGEEPSQPLAARLDCAVEYSQKNPEAFIAVSGGQGTQEYISEAECMARYLIEHGISEEKIIKEDKATSTNENYRYSKKILDEMFSEYSVAVVTNDFHIFRAKQLAKLNGLDVTTVHAHTPISSSPMMYLREILAVVKLVLLKS